MSQHAIDNARAWFESIREMVAATDQSDPEENYLIDSEAVSEDEAHDRILESPLSVLVRSGWYLPGIHSSAAPAEYEILLSTGGPALRIVGELSDYPQPYTARLQWQDWGTPWTDVQASDYPDKAFHKLEATLLSYASHFYFGE